MTQEIFCKPYAVKYEYCYDSDSFHRMNKRGVLNVVNNSGTKAMTHQGAIVLVHKIRNRKPENVNFHATLQRTHASAYHATLIQRQQNVT